MKVLIKGAGDLASGIACRLHHCGMDVVMTEIGIPTTVRRTVAFSPATGYGVETGSGGGCYYCKEKSRDDNP